jgi:hypothetical protein
LMETWAIAVVARPFLMVVLAVAVLYPARKAVKRWWPEGRVKRVLLFRVSEADSYRRAQRGRSLHKAKQSVVR